MIVIARSVSGEAIQSTLVAFWIASRSLSSGGAEPVIGRAFARPVGAARWRRPVGHCRRVLSKGVFLQILPQNRDRVHLQSAKDQRPDGFSDVMLIETHRPIGKLYEAGEKTQNLQA